MLNEGMKKQSKTREVARKAVQDQIALAAIQRFKAIGFEKTTIDEIASDMGMSTRNYFRYFPSKEDVLLGPDEAFRTTFMVEFDKALPTGDLWDALETAFKESIIICSEKENREVAVDRQRLIRNTPALLARQLEMTERLQREITDRYLSVGRDEQALSTHVVSAIVRSAFACWSAIIRHGEAVADEKSFPLLLSEVMAELRPKILVS